MRSPSLHPHAHPTLTPSLTLVDCTRLTEKSFMHCARAQVSGYAHPVDNVYPNPKVRGALRGPHACHSRAARSCPPRLAPPSRVPLLPKALQGHSPVPRVCLAPSAWLPRRRCTTRAPTRGAPSQTSPSTALSTARLPVFTLNRMFTACHLQASPHVTRKHVARYCNATQSNASFCSPSLTPPLTCPSSARPSPQPRVRAST